jgi:diguanylate cyclase (GGDEF)-like protein
VSRAQTLVLALLVLHLLLGALSLVVARGEHRSPALRWWGWGLLVYSAGLFVTVAANLGWVAPPVAGFAGNSLVTLAPVLCALGIVSHTLYRPSLALVTVGVAATVAVLAFGNFADVQRLLVNMIAPTPMAVAMFLIAAWVIARQGPRDARSAGLFLAGLCVLAVATWLTRIAVMLAMLGGTAERERIDIVISLFAIMQMVNGVASTLALLWIDVRLMQAELSRVAHSDALTSLPNRRAIRLRFAEEIARAARAGQRFAIAIFDIDHFKRINDTYGHALGDEVLKTVSRALTDAKRTDDVLGRIGGEEFLVVLGEQTAEAAREGADRLRHAVAAAEVSIGADKVPVTVSGGVALYPDDGADWDHLFAAADRRLYAAKAAGRNRVGSEG